MTAEQSELIVVGKIAAPYGVRGWVKVFSYTEPMENLLHYQPWRILQKGEWKEFAVNEGRVHGKALVAHIAGIDDRDSAERLNGCTIAINRHQLPAAEPGEYYWIDMIGSRVINQQGIELGVVDHLLETGANDVLVVREEGVDGETGKERLIPFVMQEFIKTVDVENKTIYVDWDVDF